MGSNPLTHGESVVFEANVQLDEEQEEEEEEEKEENEEKENNMRR